MIPLAIDRGDVAAYVNALFIVYFILILCNVLLSFVPRVPYNRALRAAIDFITETTDPYLNLFRRIVRPIGGAGGFALDISPILAILVLSIAWGIVVRAILE